MNGLVKEGRPKLKPRSGWRLSPGPSGWQSDLTNCANLARIKSENKLHVLKTKLLLIFVSVYRFLQHILIFVAQK